MMRRRSVEALWRIFDARAKRAVERTRGDGVGVKTYRDSYYRALGSVCGRIYM